MGKMLPFRISSLILAYLSGTISEEETSELAAWRASSEENEALFRRVVSEGRYLCFLQRSEEHDYHSRYAILERKMRRDHRRMIIRNLGRVVACLIPLVVAVILFFPSREPVALQTVAELIEPGSVRASLLLANGEVVELHKNISAFRQIDNHIVTVGDTLRYLSGKQTDTSSWHTLMVPAGGEFFVSLSDGTKVWLNAGTRLCYPVGFDGIERKVSLEGEAYFEVTRDSRPFIVASRGQEVTVLGTSFAVRAYPDEPVLLTTLESGKVSVVAGGEQVILSPGEQSVVRGNTIELREVETLLYTAWRSGRFVFKNQPLGEIFAILSRWYNIEVTYESEGTDRIRFTGELPRYSDIAVLLEQFEVLEKVRFTLEGRNVIVSEY